MKNSLKTYQLSLQVTFYFVEKKEEKQEEIKRSEKQWWLLCYPRACNSNLCYARRSIFGVGWKSLLYCVWYKRVSSP